MYCRKGDGAIAEGPVEFLYVVDNLRAAGAQRVLLTLVRALDRDCVRPVVWCLGKAHDLDDDFRAAGAEVTRFSRLGLMTGVALLCMRRALRRRPVVLMHSFLWHADQITRLLGPMAGVPAVIASVRAVDRGKSGWECRIDRALARRADLTIAVSRGALDNAIACEGVPAERAEVVNNGVNTTDFDHIPHVNRTEIVRGLRPESRIIGVVGRLHGQKGHAFLLEAMGKVRAEFPDAHLLVVGDGPLEKPLRDLARRLDIAGAVHFLGKRNDVPKLLTAMDVFCLPSLYEGMPNALLEAMAASRPCIATPVEGSADIIIDGESGLFVPPREVDALADAILRLLADPDAAKAMGRAARKRVEQHFSVQRMLRGYEACYRDVLNRKLPDGWAAPIFRQDALTP